MTLGGAPPKPWVLASNDRLVAQTEDVIFTGDLQGAPAAVFRPPHWVVDDGTLRSAARDRTELGNSAPSKFVASRITK
jgi:hypothetical protein